MEELDRAKLKDRIIGFLIENYTSAWGIDSLFINLKKPTNSKAHLIEIIGEMIDQAGKYFNFRGNPTFGYTLSVNDFTKEFLEQGGFVAEYKKQLEAAQKLNEAAKREESLKELQEIELKQKISYSTPSILISSFSFTVALISLIVTCRDSKQELNEERLKVIEGRLDSLETSTAKKVDSVTIKKDMVK